VATPTEPRTAAATRERLRRAAYRAAENPAEVARAVRIVQAAAERLVSTWPPLTPEQRSKIREILAPVVSTAPPTKRGRAS